MILDVVYNHLGPDGNYLKPFAPAYFTDKYKTEWGEAINFDGPDSRPGAGSSSPPTPATGSTSSTSTGCGSTPPRTIFDDTPDRRSTSWRRSAGGSRAAAGPGRRSSSTRTSRSTPKLVRPVEHGGYGLDALWNDDFHHSAMVALTGRNEAYYTDYLGTPQEFISAAKYGYLYQGQWYSWQEQAARAGRGWTCRRRRSSRSSRTTTRWPTPAAGCGRTSSPAPADTGR